MPSETEKKRYVETLILEPNVPRAVAIAEVRVGEVLIKGVKVWQHPKNGKLREYFPAIKFSPLWSPIVSLEKDKQQEIEADVIATYLVAKEQSDRMESKNKGGKNEHD